MFKWSYNEIWMFLRDNYLLVSEKKLKCFRRILWSFCEFCESFEKFERLRDEFVKETQRRSFVWLFLFLNFSLNLFLFVFLCVFFSFFFLFSFFFCFLLFCFLHLDKTFFGEFSRNMRWIWRNIFVSLFFQWRSFGKCVEVCRMK